MRPSEAACGSPGFGATPSDELRGLDVYDPTIGEIRSNSTDEIACWFIDTDYNEESFFVRHAYFTGADEPYKKLQRALKAEIDPADGPRVATRTRSPPLRRCGVHRGGT